MFICHLWRQLWPWPVLGRSGCHILISAIYLNRSCSGEQNNEATIATKYVSHTRINHLFLPRLKHPDSKILYKWISLSKLSVAGQDINCYKFETSNLVNNNCEDILMQFNTLLVYYTCVYISSQYMYYMYVCTNWSLERVFMNMLFFQCVHVHTIAVDSLWLWFYGFIIQRSTILFT